MDLNRYKLDNTYVRAILLLWADGVPWPSGARDRVPGAPTQARFGQLGSRHSVADGHAVLPIAPVLGYLRAATAPPWLLPHSCWQPLRHCGTKCYLNLLTLVHCTQLPFKLLLLHSQLPFKFKVAVLLTGPESLALQLVRGLVFTDQGTFDLVEGPTVGGLLDGGLVDWILVEFVEVEGVCPG